MQLQTGKDDKGNDVPPGTPGGLTDLFVHLSQIQHSSGMYYKTRNRAFMEGLLETYPHMTQEIKDAILAYADEQNDTTVDKIADLAAKEVKNMWKILGMC